MRHQRRASAAAFLRVAQALLEEREHVVIVERVEHVRPARRARTIRAPRSSRSWCETADSDSRSAAGEVLHAHLGPRQHVENAHAGRVAEHPEDLGQVVDVGGLKN